MATYTRDELIDKIRREKERVSALMRRRTFLSSVRTSENDLLFIQELFKKQNISIEWNTMRCGLSDIFVEW